MPIGVATLKILSGDPVGSAVNIWAFACTLYKILGSSSLFELSWASKDEVPVEVVRKFLGPPEQEALVRYFYEDIGF